MHKKAILLIGLFINPKDPKKNIRTSADRNSEMFKQNNIHVITTSAKSGRLARLIENIQTIFQQRKNYRIAVVPLFGTCPSFLWQAVMVFLLKKVKKKIVISVHGGSIPSQMDKKPNRFLNAVKKADAVVCPSNYLFNYFRKYNVETILIENSVNLKDYFFNKKKEIRPRIIWMRAFQDVYNPEMAVRVASKLSKKFPDFKMVMAGKEGALNESTKKLAVKLNVDDKIIFPGYIDMQEKLALAKDFDIYICTNKIDNAPISFIEFMALGLPIVSVNSGGIPDIITHEKNGLLVDLDDDDEMIKQIEKLISNPSFAQQLIDNAKNYATQYDDKNVLKKWLNLFDTLRI